MGIRFQCLKELFVWLTKGELRNVRHYLPKSLFAAPTVWRAEKYHASSASINFTNGRVSPMAVISCRFNQSFPHHKTSKAVANEHGGPGLSIYVSASSSQLGRIKRHKIPFRNLTRPPSNVSAWPKTLSLLA